MHRFRRRDRARETIVLLRQLSGMLAAGIPVARCVEILEKMQPDSALRAALFKIKNRLQAGFALHDSLRAEPEWFDAFSCRLVFLGEQTGKLDTILLALTQHHEKRADWQRNIRKALFYPCILMVTAAILSLCMFIFIIPAFAELFADRYQQLPWLTRMIFAFSAVIRYALPVLVLAIVAGIYFIRRQKISWQRLPPFSASVRDFAAARFTRNLALALSAGVPILEALKLAAGFGHAELEHAVTDLRSAIHAGHSLHDALSANTIFPAVLRQMAEVGEESGALDAMLLKAASILETALETRMERFIQLLEPLIMCVLGVLIGGLVIGMYLPVFNLGSAF